MKETAEELREIILVAAPMFEEMEAARIEKRPAPGKWCAKEILGHLIDSAANNHQKFVRTMEQSPVRFPKYAQNEWVNLQNWMAADWEEMILLWALYNRHLAFLIEHVDAGLLENEITVEDSGPFKLGFIMADYVEHLKHHLLQVFPGSAFESSFENIYKS